MLHAFFNVQRERCSYNEDTILPSVVTPNHCNIVKERGIMRSALVFAAVFLCFSNLDQVKAAFVSHALLASQCSWNSVPSSPLYVKKNNDNTVPDAVTKASWYAVEAFGNVFQKYNKGTTPAVALAMDQPPRSMRETQERIRMDNERYYFLSGTIDEFIYSEDCTFADPFVSFKGRDRFVQNLSNLGSFISEYKVKQLDYTVSPDENAVITKFMVKLQLNLPWKPVLAWPWGVRCVIDPETNLIVLHEESVRN
jgi:Uncharacterized conserved protein (DUF2358)